MISYFYEWVDDKWRDCLFNEKISRTQGGIKKPMPVEKLNRMPFLKFMYFLVNKMLPLLIYIFVMKMIMLYCIKNWSWCVWRLDKWSVDYRPSYVITRKMKDLYCRFGYVLDFWVSSQTNPDG
jgi:hypothetical protein